MRLAHDGVLPLAAGLGPDLAQSARAAGLDDRGALAPGLLADAIVVDDRVPGLPRVCATIVGGELRYATGAFLGQDDASAARQAA